LASAGRADEDARLASSTTEFTESHAPIPREQLLERRIGDLHLQLAGTRLERLVARLYEELGRAGLGFRPPVYLSDDWGCPDRIPIIGVPFYLADAQLTRLEDELREGVEAESDDQIMRYLRHEAGHAFNYAYGLFDTPEWTAVFGPFSRPYADDYTPNPFSRSFVRHLPAWYAQKHPDEDFAETFAVWLNPASHWREIYSDWPCLKKLEFLDELAQRIGMQPPAVTADTYNVHEEFLESTLAEHYRRTTPSRVEIPCVFDAALRDVFPPGPDGPGEGEPAHEFLRRHRRAMVGTVFHWTGLNDGLIRALMDHLEERCRTQNLRRNEPEPAALIEIVVLVTALCMNRLHTGDFVTK
jgi:hypothetical protein